MITAQLDWITQSASFCNDGYHWFDSAMTNFQPIE